MAFESGWIEREEDEKYVATKGFKDIFGDPFTDPLLWAVDREREVIFISRGGGGFEVPEGYALYLDGDIINMEGKQITEGSTKENNLVICWQLTAIEVPEELCRKGYQPEELKQLIVEAVTSFEQIDRDGEEVEVKVQFLTEPEMISEEEKTM